MNKMAVWRLVADWRRERQRLLQLLLCVGVVAVTWISLGFRPAYSAMGHDATHLFLPILSILHDAQGDWRALVYRPEYFGGANLLGLRGVLPLSVLLTKIGVSPLWTLNLDLFAAQALMGYLGIEAVRILAGRHEQSLSPSDLVIGICLVWLVSFSPFMGWRVNLGHLNLIYGLAGFGALVTLWLAVAYRRVTLVTGVVVLLTLVQAFCIQGFQVLIMGALFCAPVILGLAVAEPALGIRRVVGASVYCFEFTVVAVAIAAPVFIAMLTFATGMDTPRQAGHDVSIYTYMVAGWRELVDVLMWFAHGISHMADSRPVESRYGLGPILILMMLLVNRRRWPVPAALLLSLAVGVLLVARIEPISGWLVHIPFVADYRVPMRLFMPVTWLATILVCAEIVKRISATPRRIHLPLMVIAALVLVMSLLLANLGKEILVWVLALVVLSGFATRRPQVVVAAALVMVFINLEAFSTNMDMARHAGEVLAANREFGQAFIDKDPQLKMPLNRIDIDINRFDLDVSPVGKLTSITGYGFPHKQYSILVHDLVGARFLATRDYFDPTHKIANFYVVRQLYNIRYRLKRTGRASAVLVPLGPTPGPVWASDRRGVLPNQHQLDLWLIKVMHQPGWQQSQYVTIPKLARDHSPGCESLKFSTPVFSDHDRHIDIHVHGSAAVSCPVTVSMTWSSNLSGSAKVGARREQLGFYPAYGALVGFTLPRGATTITIESGLKHYGLSLALAFLGLVLALVLVPLAARSS